MNIALFASAFHPSLGGVEELCRQLAHEYQRRGWNVCVLTNRWPRSLPAAETFEGIPVFRVAMRTPDAGLKSELTFRLTSRGSERQVERILREQQTDVIHVQCVGCNAYYASHASTALNLPLVVSLQGELSMDATGLFERSKFARQTMFSALREANFVTACSHQTLVEAEQFAGNQIAGRRRVVRNGIRVADFADVTPFQHSRRYLLAIGRHVTQKGFDILIRTMALLWQSGNWDLDLILAGDGPDRDSLERLSHTLGVAEHITFPGRADRSTTVALFSGCELFVLPSRHEPFGIVNLEAMACGKPVVATRVGGVPEIVEHGVNGWLVPPNDPSSLAEAILHLMADNRLREKLAENGRKFAAEHDWSHIADQYREVYDTVTDELANGIASTKTGSTY